MKPRRKIVCLRYVVGWYITANLWEKISCGKQWSRSASTAALSLHDYGLRGPCDCTRGNFGQSHMAQARAPKIRLPLSSLATVKLFGRVGVSTPVLRPRINIDIVHI